MEKMMMQRFETYYKYIPVADDIKFQLLELINEANMGKNYLSIIPGLQELLRRGETGLLRELLGIIADKGVERNTRAAQWLDSLINSIWNVDPVTYRFAKEKFPNLWG